LIVALSMPKAYQTFQKMTALFCYNDLAQKIMNTRTSIRKAEGLLSG